MFSSLDKIEAFEQRDAPHFSCELVSQGRRRQISLARLWRKHARAQVDRGPRSRPRRRQGSRHRLATPLRRHQLGRTGFSEGEVRGAPARGPHRLAQGNYWSRGAFPRPARSSSEGTHLRTRTPHLPHVNPHRKEVTLEKILVPIDFPDFASAVIDYATKIGKNA